ncbi:prepilin-type N-terminal cleavage/methylation domain-containing protein [Campylobacter concisus]
MKRAFTLLELVVVIVVLGIIAMMSFNAIMNIYSNYFQTRTVNELETQTEIALEQISKRLEHRIKPSVIARKGGNNSSDFLALNDSRVTLAQDYEILEFIPYAYEIFNDVISLDANDNVIEQGGKPVVGRYSGYADLTKSSPATGLISPGSNFTTGVVETIKDLTCREDTNATCVDFAKKDGGVVAIFSDVYYNVQSSFGYSNGTVPVSLDIAKVGVKSTDGDTLEISGFANKQISEQYHLAYTANAIVPEQSQSQADKNNGVFDLNLYYDYRPWMGEKYKPNGEKATLAKNVTRFVFTEKNGVIVLKLCMRAKNSEITICKSKAVY